MTNKLSKERLEKIAFGSVRQSQEEGVFIAREVLEYREAESKPVRWILKTTQRDNPRNSHSSEFSNPSDFEKWKNIHQQNGFDVEFSYLYASPTLPQAVTDDSKPVAWRCKVIGLDTQVTCSEAVLDDWRRSNAMFNAGNVITPLYASPVLAHPVEPKWISVKDKLPELDTPVFAGYFSEGIKRFVWDCYVRCWNSEGWLWSRCEHMGQGGWFCNDDYSFITHWMAMPAAPEVIDND